MDLVAVNLQGTGGHDRRQEAILEIALVPMINWHLQPTLAYRSVVNPQRPVPRRLWIPLALTEAVLRAGPSLEQIEPTLADRINGKFLVGYDLRAKWQLLHRNCPKLDPAGLIDTLRLARMIDPGHRHDLGSVISRLGLTRTASGLADQVGPRRTMWDAVASGLLLGTLARPVLGPDAGTEELLAMAGVRAVP